MSETNKVKPIGYRDGGNIRGTYKVNINGVTILIKEGKVANPSRQDKEYGLKGQPDSADYIEDFSTMSVTVMNKVGMPALDELRFFPFAFKDNVWILASTEFAFSSAGLQVYNGEIHRLYNDPVDPVYPE
jgi:hypothetical protein